jgi:thymidylate synthase (FAD)
MNQVNLVHITPNAEELISYMARVSNPNNQNNTETSDKLIRYLIKHKHWSPFEMVNMCVDIRTTRSVAAQILRHRSFSFQEFSQRYAKIQQVPFLPQLRRQDTKNRQNSIDDLDEMVKDALTDEIDHHFAEGMRLYNRLLEQGVAKECARDVLPLATSTHLYMNGTIRSWLHYCELRCANGTQSEHQDIALAVRNILFKNVPGIAKAMWSHD